MALAEQSPIHVFISYSHKDEVWLERLHEHLRPLERERAELDIWSDRRIVAGSKWREEIDTALARAHIAILLVSVHFLASDFIAENELPPLLEAAKERGTKILPVIVSPCRFEKTPALSQFQAVNRPSESLIDIKLADQEKILLKVADAVEARSGAVCQVRPGPRVVPTASPLLPAAPPCFGRDEEIEELIRVVLSDNPAPVCVLGGPGIGKSTLTLKALNDERVVERFGERRWFVRCETALSRAELAAAIARDARLPTDADIEELVMAALAQAPTLLVLDNLETPWEPDTLEVEEFLGVLARCCGAALVVSLRGRERPHGVSWHDPMKLDPLADDPARRAFLEVAGQEFATDPRLDDICRALEGIPLAISLMAHQAQGEANLEGLWSRWQKKHTAILKRADGRHRLTNLEVSYEVSINGSRMTVTEAPRRLLSALSLLPDGIAWRDIPVVFPDNGNEAAATLRKAGLAFDEAGRLRVLTTLREYVGREYPPDIESQERVLSHLVDLVSNYAGKVGWEGGAEAAVRLRWEVGNVESAIPRAVAGPTPEKAIRAAVDWGQFLRFTGMGSTRPLEAAREKALSLGFTEWQAHCVQRLGDIALRRSDHEHACTLFRTARPLYQKVKDIRGEANCIKGLGDIALALPEHDQARFLYETARPLFQQVGDLLGEANCIYSLGDIALRGSDHEQAQSLYESARPLYQQVGSIFGEANCIYSLGDVALARSDHEKARTHYETALGMYQSISEPYSIGWTLRRLARIARTDEERDDHIRAARKAWQSINRSDLVENLEKELGKTEE